MCATRSFSGGRCIAIAAIILTIRRSIYRCQTASDPQRRIDRLPYHWSAAQVGRSRHALKGGGIWKLRSRHPYRRFVSRERWRYATDASGDVALRRQLADGGGCTPRCYRSICLLCGNHEVPVSAPSRQGTGEHLRRSRHLIARYCALAVMDNASVPDAAGDAGDRSELTALIRGQMVWAMHVAVGSAGVGGNATGDRRPQRHPERVDRHIHT